MELDEEEWELVNDDGFVYKRLKRLRVDPTITSVARPPDPAAEAKNRKERKKAILLKLKTRYQLEIHHWEHLSNSLKALQDRVHTQPPTPVLPDQPVAVSMLHPSDSTYQEFAETLLVQVEDQEASISEVLTLCDVAEALCNAQEQLLKQPLFYLPIWESSPQKLMTSLCAE